MSIIFLKLRIGNARYQVKDNSVSKCDYKMRSCVLYVFTSPVLFPVEQACSLRGSAWVRGKPVIPQNQGAENLPAGRNSRKIN